MPTMQPSPCNGRPKLQTARFAAGDLVRCKPLELVSSPFDATVVARDEHTLSFYIVEDAFLRRWRMPAHRLEAVN